MEWLNTYCYNFYRCKFEDLTKESREKLRNDLMKNGFINKVHKVNLKEVKNE